MKTVQDYLDLGLVFVDGDMIHGAHELINIFDQRLNTKTNIDKKVEIANGINAMKIWKLASFAWRNNDGVKPEYNGLIEVEFKDGTVMPPKKSSEIMWHLKLSGFQETTSIAKWRPVVLQSESDDLRNKLASDISSSMGSAGLSAKSIINVLNEAFKPKPPFWNKSMPIFNCPCAAVNIEASLNQPSIAELDTKQSAIHKAWVALDGELINCENGHLDLDQSQSVLLIKNGEFYYTTLNKSLSNAASNDGWELICTIQEFTDYCEKMEAEEKRQNSNDGLHYDNTAQQVEALAVNDKPAFTQAMADVGEKVKVGMEFSTARGNYVALLVNEDTVVFEHEELGFVVENHDFVHPIDTSTDREKAIDEMAESLDQSGNTIIIGICRGLYDAGYRKC